VEIGDTVTIIGGGPVGLMFVQAAKLTGCNVISVVKHDSQVIAAKRFGADEVVKISKVPDAVEAVRLARDQMERGYAPTPTMGEHCRYCPALRAGSCPAQTSLLHSLAVGPGADLSGSLTPEKARDAYRAMRQIDLVVARTWAALHAYATVHPLDLGGGLTFGPRERSRETLDGALARELLRTQYGQEVADEAAEWKVTKKSVGEALRGVAARPVAEGVRAPKISQLERQFFAALAEVGGLRRSVHVEVQEYRVRPTMTSSEEV